MTATTTAPKTDTAKTEKPAAPKTIAGFKLDQKISFGKNAEGKPFGPDNNPKRSGSKSHATFAKYKDGMTVQQASDAGIKAADISWDTKHGFIKIA